MYFKIKILFIKIIDVFLQVFQIRGGKPANVFCRLDHLGDVLISSYIFSLKRNNNYRNILILDSHLSFLEDKVVGVDKWIFIDSKTTAKGMNFLKTIRIKLRLWNDLKEFRIDKVHFLRIGQTNDNELVYLSHLRGPKLGFIGEFSTDFKRKSLDESFLFKKGLSIKKQLEEVYGKDEKLNHLKSDQESTPLDIDIVFCLETSSESKDIDIKTLLSLLSRCQDRKCALIGLSKHKDFSHSQVMNLVGKTTIDQVFNLIKNSKMFIGADSAPKHIASIFNIPIIEFNYFNLDSENLNSPTYFKGSSDEVLLITPDRYNMIDIDEKSLKVCEEFIVESLGVQKKSI
jgi:ADP-heptose:LPS heptosyltransferase